jgi:hypothetical protein
MHSSVETLLKDGSGWTKSPAALPHEVDALHTKATILPTEYLELIRHSNGGFGPLDISPYYLCLWPVEDIQPSNERLEMSQNIPGFFAFGDNGSEELFVFSMVDAKIYAIMKTQLEAEQAELVADSFVELISHVVVQSSPHNWNEIGERLKNS